MSPSINRLAAVVTSHLPRVKRDILRMTKSLIGALFPPVTRGRRSWECWGWGGMNGERSDSSLSGEEKRSESTSSRRAKLTRVRSSLKDASYRDKTAKLSINTFGLRKREYYGANFYSLSFAMQFSSSIYPFFVVFFLLPIFKEARDCNCHRQASPPHTTHHTPPLSRSPVAL